MLITIATVYHSRVGVHEKVDKEKSDERDRKISFWTKFMTALCLQRNFKSIMSTESTRSLPSIDGLRVLCSFWVVIGHTFYYSLSSIDNTFRYFVYSDIWIIQPFFAAIIAIDIFFVMSSFLFAYNFCEYQKRSHKGNIFAAIWRKAVGRYFQINLGFGIVSRILLN